MLKAAPCKRASFPRNGSLWQETTASEKSWPDERKRSASTRRWSRLPHAIDEVERCAKGLLLWRLLRTFAMVEINPSEAVSVNLVKSSRKRWPPCVSQRGISFTVRGWRSSRRSVAYYPRGFSRFFVFRGVGEINEPVPSSLCASCVEKERVKPTGITPVCSSRIQWLLRLERRESVIFDARESFCGASHESEYQSGRGSRCRVMYVHKYTVWIK